MLLRHFVNSLPNSPAVAVGIANRCIYCGETTRRLDEEHIIPESLGGRLILAKATCPCGPKKTHAFEGKVVEQIYQPIRRQLGIRGKRRKRPPTALMLRIYEKFADPFNLAPLRHVAPEQHPSLLLIPRIKPLASLGSIQCLQVLDGHRMPVDIWNLVPNYNERVKNLQHGGIQTPWMLNTVEITPLFKLLAKIGHAAAVATLGYDGFAPLLLDFISGDAAADWPAGAFIGEHPWEDRGLLPFDYPRGLHQIAVGIRDIDGVHYVAAHIRLFSNLIRPLRLEITFSFLTPSYSVFAGTLSEAQFKIAASK